MTAGSIDGMRGDEDKTVTAELTTSGGGPRRATRAGRDGAVPGWERKADLVPS